MIEVMNILSANDVASLDHAIHVLRAGGVVAHATETCYGFACDLTNPEAVKKLFLIKKRPFDQPVSALFYDTATAEEWVTFSTKAREIAGKHLPGPLTIILPVRPHTPPLFLTADKKSVVDIGVRISPHPIAKELVRRFGSPIATTSANIHSEPNPYSADALESRFQQEKLQPDIILSSGELPVALPSTVISVNGPFVTTIRRGSIVID